MLFLQADQRARIDCLAFAPDGRRLAAAGGGMVGVSVFDLYSGKVGLRYRGNRGVVRALAFSPGGELIGSADRYGQVRLWDTDTGQDRASLAAWPGGVHCVAFSRDGRVFAAGSDSWVTAAQVRRLHVGSGREMPPLRGHEGAITCLAFSPNGQLLATGSKDRTIRLWDAVSGLERTGFAARVVDFLRLFGWGRTTEEQRGTMSDRDRRQIRALAFSPDSQKIAAATGHSATLFDVANVSVLTTYTSHKALLSEVAFSPDGRALATASGDGTVKLWDVEDFTTFALRRRPTPRVTYDWEIGKVYSVAFCPDGTRVAAGGDGGRIVVWDLD